MAAKAAKLPQQMEHRISRVKVELIVVNIDRLLVKADRKLCGNTYAIAEAGFRFPALLLSRKFVVNGPRRAKANGCHM
jgi:hypothetical protein